MKDYLVLVDVYSSLADREAVQRLFNCLDALSIMAMSNVRATVVDHRG